MVRLGSTIRTVSVISRTSAEQSRPARPVMLRTSPRNFALCIWRPDTLTERVIGRLPTIGQAAASAHAVSSTQRPSGTMKPVSSASEMNRFGDTTPRTGCRQRTSASKPTRRPSARENCGWYSRKKSPLLSEPGNELIRVRRSVARLRSSCSNTTNEPLPLDLDSRRAASASVSRRSVLEC